MVGRVRKINEENYFVEQTRKGEILHNTWTIKETEQAKEYLKNLVKEGNVYIGIDLAKAGDKA